MYSASISPEFFPDAALYAALSSSAPYAVREQDSRQGFPFTERHIQCIWYDQTLRPKNLRTDKGEDVFVDTPGIWNLEEGPDFLRATLRIGPELRRIQGDVEIHIRPGDWKNHGHQNDPRYNRVRIHVTHFPGQVDAALFPPGTVHIPLRKQIQQNPYFSFESVDLSAYPYSARTGTTPCMELLSQWTLEQRQALLDAAGEERLKRKAQRLAAAIQSKGAEQVLFEEIMCALGYKHNKEAFRTLAESIPIERLRRDAEGDRDIAYAIMLGVAGLLPSRLSRTWDRDTRRFVRTLWDVWWRVKEQWEAQMLPHSIWKLSGLRPVNHPVRRLMAAAELFTRGCRPDERILYLARMHADTFAHEAVHWLETMANTYWDRRLSFNRPPLKKPTALIGGTRSASIVANVLVPFLAAMQESTPFSAGVLSSLPSESSNAIVRQTAHVLFGPHHSEKTYDNGLRTQGLLQIFHDFCMNDRTRCARCPLPDALRHYRNSPH